MIAAKRLCEATAAAFCLFVLPLAAQVPESLQKHGSPPPQFADQLGAYRSPLLFDDGSKVTTAEEWPKRRREILDFWHGKMGAWPAILDKPKVEFIKEERRENFTQKRVRVQIAADQMADAWLLVPEGAKRRPAVLVVYYEPETSIGLAESEKGKFRDYALELTRRGFVTLSIGTPGGNAWKPETKEAQCQPLSYHAYVAANCWQALNQMAEVDGTRIGVVGHSYGGKWALFAAALWEKFAAVAISDPGIVWDEKRPNVNYWEPWYLGKAHAAKDRKPGVPTKENPSAGAYAELVKHNRDLTDLHALICPRPFLVSGGAEDPPERWSALNHSIAVNNLLSRKLRVFMTNRKDHTPDAAANAVVWEFFEHFLQPGK